MYPFSSNVQRGILYLLKDSHDFFTQISPLVKSEYFEYPTHARIYDTVQKYYDEYLMLPTDDFIVEDIRKEIGDNGKISDYVEELEDIIDALNQPWYVRLWNSIPRFSLSIRRTN